MWTGNFTAFDEILEKKNIGQGNKNYKYLSRFSAYDDTNLFLDTKISNH